MGTVDLVLKRRKTPGASGYMYDVMRGGAVLVSSINPEFKACRALVAEGVSGNVRFWREGRAEHDSEFDIERAAKRTVSENINHGPRVVKFTEFQPGIYDEQP